jgi:hypothetical protein
MAEDLALLPCPDCGRVPTVYCGDFAHIQCAWCRDAVVRDSADPRRAVREWAAGRWNREVEMRLQLQRGSLPLSAEDIERVVAAVRGALTREGH